MKRFRFGFCCMLIGCITAFMTACVLANSSWVWISETRPLDLLPIVIAGTLLIEVAAVLLAMRKQKYWKVLFFVTLGNLLSFAAPYLYNYLSYSSVGFSFLKYLDHWPSFAPERCKASGQIRAGHHRCKCFDHRSDRPGGASDLQRPLVNIFPQRTLSLIFAKQKC